MHCACRHAHDIELTAVLLMHCWTDRGRYPGLANILDDEPCTPAHNVISNNILCEGATSRSFGLDPAKARGWNSTMENNTVVAAC